MLLKESVKPINSVTKLLAPQQNPVPIPLSIASFFTGVGGIDLGFEQTGKFATVFANEYDKYPATVFQTNFPDVPIAVSDIREIEAMDIPDFDIMVAGFPCQPFSIAGLRQGFDDEKGRGNLFYELTHIISVKLPRVVFLENVKNLVTHDNRKTLETILNLLKGLGYQCTFRVFNATEYGNIPQNRERIYILAFRENEDNEKFQWPEPVERTTTIKNFIDFHNPVDDKYYYIPGRYKGKLYEKLALKSQDDDLNNPTVYQLRRKYVRENKNDVVPCLTANMGGGGHNVPIVKTETGIRKLTPRECFNVQGFPSDFILPEGLKDSRLYKMAGNSVCVPVVERIAEKLVEALEQ